MPAKFALPAADVDGGAVLGVGLGLAQDLVGDGGRVALPEEQEPQQVDDRVALRPPEVTVRRLLGGVSQVEEQRGARRRLRPDNLATLPEQGVRRSSQPTAKVGL